MTASLSTFVSLFGQQLATLDHLLGKGAAFAASQGVSEAEMLGWRLVEDMQPLSFQVQVVINFATQWPARAAGLEIPADVAGDLDVAGYKAAIAKARDWIAAFPAGALEAREDEPLTYEIGTGMVLTFPRGQWLTSFAATNLYFHLSTAYGILRARGCPIGKADLFAGGI